QHTGLGDEETARFDRQLELRVYRLDLFQPAGPGVQIERLVIGAVRDRQAAANIEDLHAADTARKPGHLVDHLLPMAAGLDAAAQMRVQAADTDIQAVGQRHELVHALRRQAELGLLAAGIDLLVMAVAMAQIDTQPQRAATEYLRPALQQLDVVHGDGDATGKRGLVFGDRRETRGEQHALRGYLRYRGEHMLDLAQRHALQAEAFGGQRAQNL